MLLLASTNHVDKDFDGKDVCLHLLKQRLRAENGLSICDGKDAVLMKALMAKMLLYRFKKKSVMAKVFLSR